MASLAETGQGKTTLLSLLSAQNPKTQGEILLDGQNVWENQEALKHIYFFQRNQPKFNGVLWTKGKGIA